MFCKWILSLFVNAVFPKLDVLDGEHQHYHNWVCYLSSSDVVRIGGSWFITYYHSKGALQIESLSWEIIKLICTFWFSSSRVMWGIPSCLFRFFIAINIVYIILVGGGVALKPNMLCYGLRVKKGDVWKNQSILCDIFDLLVGFTPVFPILFLPDCFLVLMRSDRNGKQADPVDVYTNAWQLEGNILMEGKKDISTKYRGSYRGLCSAAFENCFLIQDWKHYMTSGVSDLIVGFLA